MLRAWSAKIAQSYLWLCFDALFDSRSPLGAQEFFLPVDKMLSLLMLAAATCIQLASTQSLEECVETPSNATCASFQYSEELAKADLDSLCRQMPFMVGCSLRKQCQDAGLTTGTCTSFSLLVHGFITS